MRRPSSEAAPAERILFLLKTRGELSAAAIAERLGVTSVAVRQQLDRLTGDGLVRHRDERGRVGRPRRLWSLTAAGAARFPDNHADLTVEMIASARAAFGEKGLDRLLDARTAAQLRRYREVVPEDAPLAERVAALCRQRDAEGYLAEWRRRGGGFVLVENHCPICAAAAECQGLCRQELVLFARVLGPDVAVERDEHLLSGARRCAYAIRPR